MNKHDMTNGAIGVGGLAALGHFADMIQPILADLSYLGAIVLGAWTLYHKWQHRNDK